MGLLTKWRGLCLMTLLMGLVSVQSISARDLTTAEQVALAQAVDRYNEIMNTRDWEAMVAAVPPRMLDKLLEGTGATKEQGIKKGAAVIGETMAKLKTEFRAMDLAKALKKEVADGTPYLFVPTESVVVVAGGKKLLVHSHMLALMDQEKWYLVRLASPTRLAMFVQLYPQFKGVEIPAETSEVLKE